MMTGAIYHPPRPGLPYIAAIFSGGELIESEAAFSEVEAQDWLNNVIQDAQSRLSNERGSDA